MYAYHKASVRIALYNEIDDKALRVHVPSVQFTDLNADLYGHKADAAISFAPYCAQIVGAVGTDPVVLQDRFRRCFDFAAAENDGTDAVVRKLE